MTTTSSGVDSGYLSSSNLLRRDSAYKKRGDASAAPFTIDTDRTFNSFFLQQRSRDHDFLYLRRALIDFRNL